MVIAKIKSFFEKHLKRKEEETKSEQKLESFRETEEMKKSEELKREADRLAQLKQYKTAIEEYSKALELYPFKGTESDIFKNAAEFIFKCNYNMAACYSYVDNFEKAVEFFDRALTLSIVDDSNKVRALMGKGSCYYRKKMIAEGTYNAGVFRAAMPSDWESNEKKVAAYKEEDKKKSLIGLAHECFTKAVEFDKNHIEGWYDKGHMEFLMGKIKEAVQSFDSVLTLNKYYENKESIPLFDEIKRERGIQIKASELSDRSEFSEAGFKTKTGHMVRSKAEMMIANFLFDNNLLFQYNTVATWADKDDFKPCFYVPKLDLYIDHHQYDYIKEYQKLMRGKVKQYEKHKKKNISVLSEDENNIEEALRLKMKPYIVL